MFISCNRSISLSKITDYLTSIINNQGVNNIGGAIFGPIIYKRCLTLLSFDGTDDNKGYRFDIVIFGSDEDDEIMNVLHFHLDLIQYHELYLIHDFVFLNVFVEQYRLNYLFLMFVKVLFQLNYCYLPKIIIFNFINIIF